MIHVCVCVCFRNVVGDIQAKNGVSKDAAARIQVIQISQAKQAKSSCSVTRKDRLLTALFKDFEKFRVTVDLYRGILKKFEGYTKLLQSEKPLVHLLHEGVFSLVRKVVGLFIRRNHVPHVSVKEMSLAKKVRDRDIQVSDKNLCVGEYCYSVYIEALRDPKSKHWAMDIATNLRKGYGNAPEMLLQKLPLQNVILRQFSSPKSLRR